MSHQKLSFVLVIGIVFAALFVLAACDTAEDTELGAEEQQVRPVEPVIPRNDIVLAGREVDPIVQKPVQMVTPTALPQDIMIDAQAMDQLFINIYARTSLSVVNIEIVQDNMGFNVTSSGSGFVIDKAGNIATNSHVVRDANEIYVTFSDGYVAPATLVGSDDYSDLAVINVDTDPTRLIPVELGDSNELQIGQHVVAIGNPFGLQSSMTTGIVSATGRALPSAELLGNSGITSQFNNPSIIQVDATVNPGNSGGPILDLSGRVMGIATAIRTETGVFQGVAFAVPVNTFKRVFPQLIEHGFVEYPWLGISSHPEFTVAEIAEEFDLPVTQGVLIEEVIVEPPTPSSRAGLRGGSEEVLFRGDPIRVDGDIIIAIDGKSVRDLDELLAYLVENTSPGDTVILTVVRGEQTFEVPVELEARPTFEAE
jgi:S1-C subfamily serine protease